MERIETRMVYGDALADLGAARPDIVVLDADLYKSTRSVVFAQKFPTRFFDMGIAEQDMLSTAAGLAASGFVPYTNSFALFITARCYDQIRVQIAYPSLPVKIVGSSAGLTQGPDGASHQSLEDVTLMRALPNMTVVVPADEVETRQATAAIADVPGPVYFRLGRYPTPRLFGKDYQFKVGTMATLREGADIAILACGHMTAKALDAADLLTKDGVHARVVNVSTIKPMPAASVLQAVKGCSHVFTVEEHNIIGGLGSAVAEAMAEHPGAPLHRLGVRDAFGESGVADELLEKFGLQPQGLYKSITSTLRKKK